MSLKIAKAAGMAKQNVKTQHRSEEWQDKLLNRMLLLIDLLSNHWIITFCYKVPSFNLYFYLKKKPSQYSEKYLSNEIFTVHVTYNLASRIFWLKELDFNIPFHLQRDRVYVTDSKNCNFRQYNYHAFTRLRQPTSHHNIGINKSRNSPILKGESHD